MRVFALVVLLAAATQAADVRRASMQVDASLEADLLSPDLKVQEKALKKLQEAQKKDEAQLKETEAMLAKEAKEAGDEQQDEQQQDQQQQDQQQQDQVRALPLGFREQDRKRRRRHSFLPSPWRPRASRKAFAASP